MNTFALRDWLPTLSQHFLIGALAVLCYVITTRLRREQRAPATAIAWVMGLALMPYFVLPMYLLFGQRKLRPAGVAGLRRPGPPEHWACDLIESMGLAPAGMSTPVQMHRNGEEAQQGLFALIDSARSSLDVCTFIIGDDRFGDAVVQRLAGRAGAGIAVRVLLDGFGAVMLPRRTLRLLRRAGCEVTVFRPFFSLRRNGPRNLRNHRKLVIADDARLWSGGRNLAAEYFEGKDGEPPWRDISFVLDGPCAVAAAWQFEQDWASVRQRQGRRAAPALQAPAQPSTPGASPSSLAQFLPSGPDQLEDTAKALLMGACFRAERRILAITPYFVPDDALRDAMRLAARRGIAITLVIPQVSNHRMADFVRTRAMRDLAGAGVKFLMLPFMAHAKAVVLDDSMALCGSINLDLRSLLLNHEASVVFYSRAEIDWLAQWIEQTAASAAVFEPQRAGLLRDIAEGLVLTIAFQL